MVLNHIVVSHEDVLALTDRFYIALHSVLEQTHCGLVACGCEWATVGGCRFAVHVHGLTFSVPADLQFCQAQCVMCANLPADYGTA